MMHWCVHNNLLWLRLSRPFRVISQCKKTSCRSLQPHKIRLKLGPLHHTFFLPVVPHLILFQPCLSENLCSFPIFNFGSLTSDALLVRYQGWRKEERCYDFQKPMQALKPLATPVRTVMWALAYNAVIASRWLGVVITVLTDFGTVGVSLREPIVACV